MNGVHDVPAYPGNSKKSVVFLAGTLKAISEDVFLSYICKS
jgi:hypothetical protein